MGNAINNSNQTNNASQLADMRSRMAAGKQGDGSGSESFSSWMNQHQALPPGNLAAAQATHPSNFSAPVRSPVANALSNAGGARLQAARVAQQAQQAHQARSANPEPERASSNQASRQVKARNEQAPKQANRPANANQAKSTDEAKDAQGTDRTAATESSDDAGDASTRFSTAMGEGSAEVRELTPPTDVQPNDSASMMAWLVSLTQPDAAPALPAEGSIDGDAQGEDLSLDAEHGLALGRDDDRGDKGRGRGLALGWNLGQRDLGLDTRAAASSSAAALQVDALLGRGGSAGKEGDAFAAMMPLEGGHAAFGHTLSQVASPRHEQASIPVPLDAPDFSQKLADQVSLWVGQLKQDEPMTAELHLNPAEMGPINVKISLDGTSAHVDFAAAALETRQAIEASLATLSTALNDVGLSLSGGGVSSQTPEQNLAQGGNANQDGRGGSRAQGGRPGEEGEGADAVGMRQVSVPRTSRLGGLDLYA